MKWLDNRKIGARLGAGCGMVFAFLVAIIAFAASSFHAIERDTGVLLNEDLVKS